MTLDECITQHLALCDEIYQLAVEENRILKHQHQPPDAPWRAHKQTLSNRLDQSLEKLRQAKLEHNVQDGAALAKAQQRSLQILHLDRENEKLLLRCSLGAPRAAPRPASTPAALKAYRPTFG
jgi:hypothetical protein